MFSIIAAIALVVSLLCALTSSVWAWQVYRSNKERNESQAKSGQATTVKVEYDVDDAPYIKHQADPPIASPAPQPVTLFDKWSE